MLKIVSVEYLEETEVYDLHIDDTDHSYHVNNIPVHNSGYCRDHDNRKYYKPIRQIQHLINTHFNERSVFTPISYKADENKEVGTRASVFGQVKKESYESWYLKQDKTFQSLTLTNRKYNEFLKGKYEVISLADINKTLDLNQVNAGLQDYIK